MNTTKGIFVGIDVSKDYLDVAQWGQVRTWRVGNQASGIAKLCRRLVAGQATLIVMEATGVMNRPWLRR